jgi:hypothetical protein
METSDQQSRDERLFFAAAGHHALSADEHTALAVSHERDGDPEAAARERTMAQAARDTAQRFTRASGAVREPTRRRSAS